MSRDKTAYPWGYHPGLSIFELMVIEYTKSLVATKRMGFTDEALHDIVYKAVKLANITTRVLDSEKGK